MLVMGGGNTGEMLLRKEGGDDILVMGASGQNPDPGDLMHEEDISIRKTSPRPPLLPDHVRRKRRHSVLALPAPRDLARTQVQQHILAAGRHRQTAATAAASASAPARNEAAGALQAA